MNVHEGGSYLFFFAKAEDGQVGPLISRTVFAVEHGRLVDTWRDRKRVGDREPLDGVALNDARREVKRAAAAKKRE